MRLETQNELSEAIRMYKTLGYGEVVPVNDEPYADHWLRSRSAQRVEQCDGLRLRLAMSWLSWL